MEWRFNEWLMLLESEYNENNFEAFRKEYIDPFINQLLSFANRTPNYMGADSKADLEKYKNSMEFYNQLGWKFGKQEYGNKYDLGSAHPSLSKIISAGIKDPTNNKPYYELYKTFDEYLQKASTYGIRARGTKNLQNVFELLKHLFHQKLVNATANLSKKKETGIGQTGEETGGDLEGVMVGQHRTASQLASTEAINLIMDCLRKFYAMKEQQLSKSILNDQQKIESMIVADNPTYISLNSARINLIKLLISKVFNHKKVVKQEYDGIEFDKSVNSLSDDDFRKYLEKTGRMASSFLQNNQEIFKSILNSDPNLANYAYELYVSILYLIVVMKVEKSQVREATSKFLSAIPSAVHDKFTFESLNNLRQNYLLNPKAVMGSFRNVPEVTTINLDEVVKMLIDPDFPQLGTIYLLKFLSPIYILANPELLKNVDKKDCNSMIANWDRTVEE